ncbi:MAG TPA: proline--tRNA ligase, partial [Jiangellaceae bacterium]
IQTKFRDEARPRAGLLRGREFTMKDSYSFDVDDAGLQRSYEQHRQAYINTFDRLGLSYVICAASSGAMGGNVSEEFLAPTEVGEDTFVRCTKCDYAANVEAVVTPVPEKLPYDDVPRAHDEDTPDTPTIESLVTLSNQREDLRRSDRDWTAADMLKNVVVVLQHPDGDREPVVIGVPGDREVDMKRLEAQVGPAVPEAFTEEDFAARPQLVRGYIGPQALGEASPSGIRYLVDPRVVEGTRWVTGANKFGRHVYDLVAGRDFTPDGTIEAAEVRVGDACPRCDGTLELVRGIEIGHIFQLGRWFAEALDLKVLDQNGKLVTVTMGSYGIGVSRAVAAIAEQSHDELGLIWPREVAPADVHLIATGKKDDVVFDVGDRLAGELEEAGVRVLYDDRQGVSPGVKFADSELIGVPTIVVAGRRLAEGVIEIKDRRTGERTDVPIEDAVTHLAELVAQT